VNYSLLAVGRMTEVVWQGQQLKEKSSYGKSLTRVLFLLNNLQGNMKFGMLKYLQYLLD
jgi:hypothetical protein